MNNLIKVIGPSPSEMTLEQLEEAIRREHSRVSQGLEAGATVYGAKKGKKRASSPSRTTKAKSLEQKYGMSLEEMERKLELLRKLEEGRE